MVAPLLGGLVAQLAANGLNLLANAVMAKGQAVVEEKLGVKLDEMVSSDEGRVKLAQIQMEREADLHEFILAQREQEIRSDKMYLDDVSDARSREVAIANSDKAPIINKVITPILAIGVLLLTFLLFALVMVGPEISPTRKDIVIYVLGVLSAISTQIIAYYFGSSRGSSMKDETIQALGGGK